MSVSKSASKGKARSKAKSRLSSGKSGAAGAGLLVAAAILSEAGAAPATKPGSARADSGQNGGGGAQSPDRLEVAGAAVQTGASEVYRAGQQIALPFGAQDASEETPSSIETQHAPVVSGTESANFAVDAYPSSDAAAATGLAEAPIEADPAIAAEAAGDPVTVVDLPDALEAVTQTQQLIQLAQASVAPVTEGSAASGAAGAAAAPVAGVTEAVAEAGIAVPVAAPVGLSAGATAAAVGVAAAAVGAAVALGAGGAGGAAAAAAAAAGGGVVAAVAGVAAKGILSGATAFYDFSGDGKFTAGVDAFAITDTTGHFSINLTAAQKTQVESGLNNLGKTLKLIVTGGNDVTNGTAFTGTLSSVADTDTTNTSQINVFSTLKASGMATAQLTELLGKDYTSLSAADFDNALDPVETLALKLWGLVSDKVGDDADAAEAAMTALGNTLELLSAKGDLATMVNNLSAGELETVVGATVDKAMALFNAGATLDELDTAMQSYAESLDTLGVFTDIADGSLSLTYDATLFDQAADAADATTKLLNLPTITEAEAVSMIAAGGTPLSGSQSMQAVGTQVTPTLKQLQALGVEAVLVDSAVVDANPNLHYGLTIELGSTGVLATTGIPELVSSLQTELIIADGQVAEVAGLATDLADAGVDVIGAADGTLTVGDADFDTIINAGLSFASETEVTAQLSNVSLTSLIADIDASLPDTGIDIVDLVSNAASINETQAGDLISAGIHFASGDTITVQAQGTAMSTSLKDLQQLGVDVVLMDEAVVGAPHDIELSLGTTGTLSPTGIPTFSSSYDVSLNIADTQVAEVAGLAAALHTAGIDYIGGADGSLTVADADLQTIFSNDLHFAKATEVTAQFTANSGIDTLVTTFDAAELSVPGASTDFGVDIIDMTTNTAAITEAQAGSLILAGVEFAAADVVTEQAAGTQLSTTLKELQDLGVDHVNAAAALGAGHDIVLQLGNVATGADPAAELLAFLQTYQGQLNGAQALFDGPTGSVDVALEVTQTVYDAIQAAPTTHADIVTALVNMGVDEVKVIGTSTEEDLHAP